MITKVCSTKCTVPSFSGEWNIKSDYKSGRFGLIWKQMYLLSHPRVTTYINFVELHCMMPYAKFQNYRPSGSGEEDF